MQKQKKLQNNYLTAINLSGKVSTKNDITRKDDGMRIDPEKFKEARRKAGLSREELAREGEISTRTIQNYEIDGGNVNSHILAAMAKAMKVDPQSLAIGK